MIVLKSQRTQHVCSNKDEALHASEEPKSDFGKAKRPKNILLPEQLFKEVNKPNITVLNSAAFALFVSNWLCSQHRATFIRQNPAGAQACRECLNMLQIQLFQQLISLTVDGTSCVVFEPEHLLTSVIWGIPDQHNQTQRTRPGPAEVDGPRSRPWAMNQARALGTRPGPLEPDLAPIGEPYPANWSQWNQSSSKNKTSRTGWVELSQRNWIFVWLCCSGCNLLIVQVPLHWSSETRPAQPGPCLPDWNKESRPVQPDICRPV